MGNRVVLVSFLNVCDARVFESAFKEFDTSFLLKVTTLTSRNVWILYGKPIRFGVVFERARHSGFRLRV